MADALYNLGIVSPRFYNNEWDDIRVLGDLANTINIPSTVITRSESRVANMNMFISGLIAAKIISK